MQQMFATKDREESGMTSYYRVRLLISIAFIVFYILIVLVQFASQVNIVGIVSSSLIILLYGYTACKQVNRLLFWKEVNVPDADQILVSDSHQRTQNEDTSEIANKHLSQYGIKILKIKSDKYVLIERRKKSDYIRVTQEYQDLLGMITVLWHHDLRLVEIHHCTYVISERASVSHSNVKFFRSNPESGYESYSEYENPKSTYPE